MAQFICLHHGSNVVVDAPEWNRGSRYRDFGQCFYTTYSEQMAKTTPHSDIDWTKLIPEIDQQLYDKAAIKRE